MGQASLLYIFLTFLKLGATAFGGYMSLIAIVQKQLVEVDKKLKEEDLLDGILLTSVLPGPVAVNTIAYVGYRLRGVSGAIVAFIGIIIPSFLLVILLSWLYFSYGNIPAVKYIQRDYTGYHGPDRYGSNRDDAQDRESSYTMGHLSAGCFITDLYRRLYGYILIACR